MTITNEPGAQQRSVLGVRPAGVALESQAATGPHANPPGLSVLTVKWNRNKCIPHRDPGWQIKWGTRVDRQCK